jgi:hypothetical protein
VLLDSGQRGIGLLEYWGVSNLPPFQPSALPFGFHRKRPLNIAGILLRDSSASRSRR